jgi:hypothetical protein
MNDGRELLGWALLFWDGMNGRLEGIHNYGLGTWHASPPSILDLACISDLGFYRYWFGMGNLSR